MKISMLEIEPDSNFSGTLLTPSSERWLSFVGSMPNATIFHHAAWINMITECYGYHPFVVAIRNSEGAIVAGLPMMEVDSWLTGRRWVALPFTDHCEPLCTDGSSRNELFRLIQDLRVQNGVPLVEVRAAAPQGLDMYQDNNQVRHHRRIESDSQAVFGTLHKTRTRPSIRRAEREGIKIAMGMKESDLDTFYNLHVNTRHRLGVPVQPRRFFELIWERLIEQGFGFALLALKDNLPIAGGIFLTFSNTLSFKYAASDSKHWRLKPNNLLIWTAIRWGCENGFTVFDMGKTNVDNFGLRDFKHGWGTQEVPLTYSRWSDRPSKKIPDQLKGLAGSLIRNSPRWVCRISGELLYKHSA